MDINGGNKKTMGLIHVYVDSASILGRVKIQKNAWEKSKSWAGKSFRASSFTYFVVIQKPLKFDFSVFCDCFSFTVLI